MVGEKMSRIEEARKRIKEQEKQISTKVSKAMQQGVNMQKNKLKLNNAKKNKTQQSFTGDVSKINIKSNISKSSSIDNLYNNVINPMNQFNSSLFYNIGKLPAKAIYKTAFAAKNVLRGEEHPFQKAQEKANETFSNFEKNVGYDTSNKDSKIQKANRAGQAVGNTLGYVLGSKALGGGALGYGATSGMNAYANTNDIGDIAFSTGKGAVFGKLNSVIGGGTKNVLERVPIMNTAISATSPSTLGSIFHFGANATKNVIAGGVGMYGAGAITGEAENIYNLIRKRDVTKKDWLKPIWSDEALSNAIIGGIIGGVSGTAADLKKAKLQYKNDYKTLIENLNNKNNAMVKALQNGELQTAQNLNQEAIEMIQAFNNMQYMGFRLDENGKNTLLNMWQATAYANAETNYRPKMLGEETPRQPLDISQLQTNTKMPKNNFNNIKNTTNINEKASTIWQNFKNNVQNSANINENTSNIDRISQNNVQNVSELQKSTQNNAKNMQNNLKNDDMGVFDTEREYNTSSLPKNEEEVETNVRNRLNKEIEKDIEIFVENNTDDYQEIASSDVDYEIEDILRKMYTEEEIDYLYDTDLSSEVFNKISDIISNELEKHFYTYNSETGMYEPNTNKLGSSDEIRFKYDKLPSTDFEYKQLDNIRNMIDDLTWNMKKTLPDGIDITVEESGASADATYITVSNENTDETYEIRVGNHFKSGTSGNADEHIRISDFKTISKLKENIKEKIENGLIDVGSENIQSDTVNEQKEKHNVDIIKESDYNNYEVERKKEPRNYIYKKITDEDKARVDSDYKLNKSKYIDKNFVHFDDVSYGYNIEDGEVKVTSKFKGSQKFIREVEEAWENGVDKLSNGNTKITESIRRIKRGGDTSNGISRKQSSSRESDRENIGNGRQQRGIDSTKTSENNGNNLKDSKQSSFSLSENNIKSNEEYDTNLSAEEKLDEYEERKKQALKKIAEKAGVEYSFLDANKGETQRNMFFFLKGHGSLKNQFVKENNINLEGITFEEKYNLIDGNPEFEKFINKITDEYFKISKPEITDEELMEIAQDIHGTTDDYSVGAYMTIDGQLLDFDYGGYRDDHRSLSVPGYDMDSFMKAGNIRMQPEGSGFEVAVEPTEAQYERLADYIDNYIDDDINVDIDGTNDGRTYPRGTDAEKIIDDIRYYFRNGEFPQKSQYANFLEEPHIKYGEQTKNETPIKVLKSTDKILKPQVVGQRIWEGFERQGYINLNSKKVESVQDIAELAQIFRNPKYETFRIIYTSGDIIVGQEAVTSYLPNQSKAFVDNNSNKAFYKMTDRMKRLSADGYYMVHNHPSGVARASKEDIKITKIISDEIVGFKGHIVVDHGTYAYISRGLNGNIEWKDEMKVDTKNALYQGSQFETNMPTNRIPWNNIKISSRDDLGSLMHNLKNSTNYSTLILCDTQNKINSIVDIPNNFFNMKQSQIEGYIRNTSKKYGATYAFVGTSSEDTFNKLKQLTNLRDSVLYQDNTEKFGDKKGNAVFAYEKKFAMRTSEETEEDLTEKKIIEIITNELDIDQKENKKYLEEKASELKQLAYNDKLTIDKIDLCISTILKEIKAPVSQENKDLIRTLRSTKLYVSKNVKNGFANWGNIFKRSFGKIKLTEDKNALPIDTFYEELSNARPDLFPSDISNASDELEKIIEIAEQVRKRNSLEREILNENGEDGLEALKTELRNEIIKIRNRYSKPEFEKRATVPDKSLEEILKKIGFTEKQIYDPANAYIQNLVEAINSHKKYYSRPLEEIEKDIRNGYEKDTNYILNKRRYDVQNGLATANAKYINGAKISDMRKIIEKHTGKKIGLKGFRQKAYGIYKIDMDSIRIKNIANIETALHELGHRVDFKEIERATDEKMNKELEELCERAFGNSYDNDLDTKLAEGWAEFIRRFVTNNEQTLKEYPQTSGFFINEMESSSELKKTIYLLIDLAENYVNTPIETQIRKMQSINEETDASEKRNFFDTLMYNFFDDLWDIKKMMKSAGKVSPSKNVYTLMRLYKPNEDRVLNVLQSGLIDDNGVKRTKGITQIFEELGIKSGENIQKVRDLLISLRSVDYYGSALKSGIAPDEAMFLIKELSGDEKILTAANEIINFQNEIMKYALEKGLLKKNDYEEMKKWNQLYVPLKRVYDGRKNSSNGSKGASNLTKRRTGSLREIIDPFESIVQNTAVILNKINQNEIMKTLARLKLNDYYEEVTPGQKLKSEISLEMFKSTLEEQGIDTEEINLDVVQKIFSPILNDEKTLTIGYYDDGKLKALQFRDKNVYDIISGADSTAKSFSNALAIFDKFTGTLRLGATSGNLEFALPNMISDTMTAWIFTESNFKPFADTLRGVYDWCLAEFNWNIGTSKYIKENKYLYDLYKQSGATMATRVGSYRPEVQNYVKEVFGKHAMDLFSNNNKKVKNAAKAIWHALTQGTQDVLSFLPEISEQATRFESFKKDYKYFIKKGYSNKNAIIQASINTRDITMDFGRMGTWMRSYNRLKAFSAARAQGIYRTIEAIQKAPKKVLPKIGLIMGVAVVLVHYAYSTGRKIYEEIAEQKKKDNFVIPTENKIITIKKPQGTERVLINLAEVIYKIVNGYANENEWDNWVRDSIEELSGLDIDLKEGNTLSDIFGTTFLPTGMEPLIENKQNKDFYYGNPIIPYGKEDLKPEDQYDENTSQLAILLGKALKQSPAKIENAITGYLAGLGQQFLDFSDYMLGKMSNDIPEQPDKTEDQQFVLKRFFTSGYKNSQSITDVYDMIEKLELKKEYDEATEEELQTLKNLKQAKETMSSINKEIKNAKSDLSMNSKEKLEKILELQELRTDTARYYLDKELINSENRDTIELYEYYPASDEYTYTPKNSLKVKVKYEEEDKKEYAQLCRKKYKELIVKTKASYSYKKADKEEKEKLLESDLTKARNYAKDIVSKKVYERGK